MSEIKEGMKVQLKSGGPYMTVARVEKNNETGQMMAWCQWFESNKGKQTPHAQSFPVTSLDMV
jgi:uncharacterized protein YodC (DUF2158 family)